MDFRSFVPLTCAYCDKAPRWAVHEDRYTPDRMYVCDDHKHSPYS